MVSKEGIAHFSLTQHTCLGQAELGLLLGEPRVLLHFGGSRPVGGERRERLYLI